MKLICVSCIEKLPLWRIIFPLCNDCVSRWVTYMKLINKHGHTDLYHRR